jgi:erythromycin esterase
MGPFHNRTDAGRILAKRILGYGSLVHKRPIVLALPRGGVPVAAPLARELFAPLDILPVKRVDHPEDPETVIGAVSEAGMITSFHPGGPAREMSQELRERLGQETMSMLNEQLAAVRQSFPAIPVEGRHVILVDDGLCTGSTMEAAVGVMRTKNVMSITIAVPVTSPAGYQRLRPQVDEFITVITPHEFYSVGSWYEDFSPVSDAQVIAALGQGVRPKGMRPPVSAVPAPELSVVRSLEAVPSPDLGGARAEIKGLARPLSDPGSLEILANRLASSRIVMLGECTHGTSEFYSLRRRLTKILLEKHGFNFVAVEGDWPDFQRLNGQVIDDFETDPEEMLRKFERWPTWMWANEEMVSLIDWMKGRPHRIYGLDIYSLFESLNLVKAFASKLDVELSQDILNRYACLDPFVGDEISYARSLLKFPEGCRKEVVGALRRILDLRLESIRLSDGELFDAQQNALIVEKAESYYRAMLERGPSSWNVRDRHMIDTLDTLLHRAGPQSKAIVWAHNSHVGDHRATDMGLNGLVSIGGLAREKYGAQNVKLVGFGTYGGSVTAGKAWGEREEIMPLPPAKKGTWESYFHQVARESGINDFWMNFDKLSTNSALREEKGQRAVGVVYKPAYEATGENYVPTKLAERYDAFVYVDHSSALPSLHSKAAPNLVPEAWPTGQ